MNETDELAALQMSIGSALFWFKQKNPNMSNTNILI